MNLRADLSDFIGDEIIEEGGEVDCRACGSSSIVGFYLVERVPSQSCVLLDGESESRSYPSGDVLLAVCEGCGFIQNTRFDSDLVDYSMPTEESQAYSPRFQEFSAQLARDLHATYHLVDRTVLEIGCGKGDFLLELADLGIRGALGIDPGFLPERAWDPATDVEFVRDHFDDRFADVTADLVLTRHLLEHVPDVEVFTKRLRRAVERTPGASMFTELPDARRVLRERAFWDIYYEHCSYFTMGSLGRMFRRLGFEQTSMELGFGDQYLLVGSKLGGSAEPHPEEDSIPEVLRDVVSFAKSATESIAAWRRWVDRSLEAGQRLAIWGGGSKAVAFATTIGLTGDDVTVVDINPHKQGKWLAGTDIEVVAPEALISYAPNQVVVMNPIYSTEIKISLSELGVSPSVMTVIDRPEGR